LGALHQADPKNEEIKRLYENVFDTYAGKQFVKESDEIENKQRELKIDINGLGFTGEDDKPLTEVLYEDTDSLFTNTADKTKRDALMERLDAAYAREITPLNLALFHKYNQFMAAHGHTDQLAYYTKTTGHNLTKLAEKAKELVTGTNDLYFPRMAEFYKKTTGHDFSEASRADVKYVLGGKSDDAKAVNDLFVADNMVPLITKTFDQMGLGFSTNTQIVDFKSMGEYRKTVNDPNRKANIFLDVAKREGKDSRAYITVAKAPSEIYLSVKPEGGVSDYDTFLHESGHANHFAHIDPKVSYPLAQMGNNTTTEVFAYLMQNLVQNKYWLMNDVKLDKAQASKVIRDKAMEDLYMMRRYAGKVQFEVKLYEGNPLSLEGKPELYSKLLTEATGFPFKADTWSRDVDPGFYTADYFTAWAMEAQLREYMQKNFGSTKTKGEDWYKNPKSGEFLKAIWAKGNLNPGDLALEVKDPTTGYPVYEGPTDVGPLLRMMKQNLNR
jgi:hypothetical protein